MRSWLLASGVVLGGFALAAAFMLLLVTQPTMGAFLLTVIVLSLLVVAIHTVFEEE